MGFMSNILSKTGISALVVGAALALSPMKSDAATVNIGLGDILNGQTENVGPLNLVGTLYRIDWFVGGESGTVNIDTYVDPFASTGLGNANLRIGLSGSGTISPTASWGGDPVTFTPTGSGLEASLSTQFTTSGSAGSKTLTFGWTGGEGNEAFSVAVSAVPLPAGGLLLLTALGGVAVLRRRRKAV